MFKTALRSVRIERLVSVTGKCASSRYDRCLSGVAGYAINLSGAPSGGQGSFTELYGTCGRCMSRGGVKTLSSEY